MFLFGLLVNRAPATFCFFSQRLTTLQTPFLGQQGEKSNWERSLTLTRHGIHLLAFPKVNIWTSSLLHICIFCHLWYLSSPTWAVPPFPPSETSAASRLSEKWTQCHNCLAVDINLMVMPSTVLMAMPNMVMMSWFLPPSPGTSRPHSRATGTTLVSETVSF